MWIVSTKSKGDYRVVVGFRKQHIDQEATKRKTIAALEKEELPRYLKTAMEAVQIAVSLPKRMKGKTRAREVAHEQYGAAMRRYKEEVLRVAQIENIVYLPPKANEKLLSVDDARPLRKAFKTLERKQYLTLSRDVVTDKVGQTLWHEVDDGWASVEITEFGQDHPPSAKPLHEFNGNKRGEIKDQIAAAKQAAKTPEQINAEKANATRGAELAAVQMRSLAEINGAESAKALESAKSWLAEKLAEIETQYL